MKTKQKRKKILICKHRAIGDSIMGLGAIRFAKELFPDSKVYYGVPHWITPIYEDVIHDADQIFPLNFTSFKEAFKTFLKLKEESFDLVFELHQSGKTKKIFSLLSFINRNLTYHYHNHHLKEGTLIKDQGVPKELIQRDLDGLASLLGIKDHWPHYLSYIPRLQSKQKIQDIKKARIIIGIVATRKTKMWPLEYYSELCKRLLELSPTLEIGIPLSKSKEDINLKRKLDQMISSERITYHFESLKQLPKLFFNSTLYIGNDTGQKHLAVACGIKTFTFFGPEPPKEWHPYSDEHHPFFYKDNLECRTRNSHFCGLSECESMICLNEITPDFVFEKIKNLILETANDR
mgnify:CR=1 FL=1|tara:strand:- start:2441 stop:3484 length:1044 start_codon:yes stop_codon:yes gene_type:complete